MAKDPGKRFPAAVAAVLRCSPRPGRPLSEIIAREGPLPLERALPILEQVAAALDHAHKRGLVHRDVKPGNIIVDAEGQAVLTDFGIVRAAEGTRLTATGLTLGTPEYMAPEQARGEEPTPSADIYSLGVVAYEMLTGEAPFRATTPLAVLMKQVSEAPPRLREKNPGLPEGVERVVEWALAKDPRARPASGAEFVAALKAAAKGHAPRAHEAPTEVLPGGLTPTSLFPPSHRAGVGSGQRPGVEERAFTTKRETENGVAEGRGEGVRTIRPAATPPPLFRSRQGGAEKGSGGAAEGLPRWAWLLIAILAVGLAVGLALVLSGGHDSILLRTPEGHADWVAWVRSVSFSPDAELLASGSSDNTVRL